MKGAVAILLLLAGFAPLTYLLVRPPAPPPAPPPPAPPPAPPSEFAGDYADAVEDAILEIEDVMGDFAAQMRRGAWGGAMHHVAADFEGSPLLREADGPPKEVGGVSIAVSGPDPRRVGGAAFAEALAKVPVENGVFKLPSAALDGEPLSCGRKGDASRPGRRWVSQGDARFVRRDGRWQWLRFEGTEIRTESGPVRFLEATSRLGLQTAPGFDDRDS